MPLLLLAYLGFVSVGLPDGMLGVAWPHMRAELDEPVGAVGFVLLVSTAFYLVSSVSAGFVIGRLGVGRLLAASTALAAAALAGFAVSPALPAVVAAGALLGLSSGAIDAGLNAYAARHFGARHMNWLHASFSFGATLGPLLVTAAVAVGLAWRGGYTAVAVGQVALAAAFAWTARAWQDRTAGVEAGPTPPVVAPAPAQPAAAGTERAMAAAPPAAGRPAAAPLAAARPSVAATLARRGTWLGAAGFGLYVAVELGVGLWAYTLLTEARGVPDGVAGVAVSGYWASLFVGRLLVGAVAGRVGVHRMLRAGLVGIVGGLVPVAVPAPGWVTVAGLLVVGLSAAPIFPLLMLTTGQRVGDAHADRVVGVQVGAAAVGGTGLPALIGVLIGRLGPAALGPSLLVLAVALVGSYVAAHPPARRRSG